MGDSERRSAIAPAIANGMAFGDVLLPIADLQPATASGLPSALALTVSDAATIQDVEARIRDLLVHHPGLEVTRSTAVTDQEAAAGDATLQTLMLVIVWGYIAIAVVNSLVIATLSRRAEFAVLRVAGATPAQRRQVTRWEAAFLAATACLIGTLAALPGLGGLAFALSNGNRILPAIDPVLYAAIVAFTFILVIAATALPTRRLLRDSKN